VLEPRSNTMRMGTLKNRLPDSLRQADSVFVYTHDLGWDAGAVFNGRVRNLHLAEDLPAMVSAITREAKPGDHVLIMSNGGFGGIHQKLLEALRLPLPA
jgi:UDP-N-acetylmuramate: L-alanyl-gamma-D-glutamyl-meso-diaminopimelate ligase